MQTASMLINKFLIFFLNGFIVEFEINQMNLPKFDNNSNGNNTQHVSINSHNQGQTALANDLVSIFKSNFYIDFYFYF